MASSSGRTARAWITDGGLNAIVRVDASTDEVRRLPAARRPSGREPQHRRRSTATGTLWFTGQAGIYGRLDPATGEMEVFDDPEGRGPYGITATPAGEVWYASLAGSHIARIDPRSGAATVVEPPTAGPGRPPRLVRLTRPDLGSRVGRRTGRRARPGDGAWQEWRLPGRRPQAYAVYVDDRDIVWLTDFGANAIVRFDPATETFDAIELPGPRRGRAPAPRPTGRGLGRRVGGRQARGRHRGLGH